MINCRLNLSRPFIATALLVLSCALAGYLCGSSLSAQESENDAPPVQQRPKEIKPIVDPAADDLLRAMGSTLESAKEFSFSADVTFDDLLPSRQKIQYGGEASVTVKRPGEVYAVYKGDLHSRKIWYDGKEVTVLDTKDNFYGQIGVPPKIDQTMDYLINDYGFTLPLSDILISDPYGSFMGNVSAGVVVGDSEIDGKRCRHLAFVEKYIDW